MLKLNKIYEIAIKIYDKTLMIITVIMILATLYYGFKLAIYIIKELKQGGVI